MPCPSALRREPADHTVFTHLWNVYINELAAFRPRLGRGVDARGIMLPRELEADFTDPHKHPCVLWLGERPVGLLVWSTPGPEDAPDGCARYVEELFVLPSFRRLGLGEQALRAFLREEGGVCGACIYRDNEPSQRLLARVCAQEGLPLSRESAAWDADIWFCRAGAQA